MRRKKTYNFVKISKLIINDFLTLIVIIAMLIPFIWLVLTSFKSPLDFLSWPPVIIPEIGTLKHYIAAFSQPMIFANFSNSIIIAIGSTFFSVIFGSAAAYSALRIKMPFKLNNVFLLWVLITRMYPAICTAIPYYMLIQRLGIMDTKLALIITYSGFNLPFVVWLMLGFFQAIPRGLEDAAIVDGCNFFQRFTKIIFPLSAPGLVATTILSFILAWNEFLFAIILTQKDAKTVPVFIAGFIGDRGMEWGTMTATGTLFVLPVIILAWFSQRYLIRGLTLGAVKG